jgi:hypothetical protein
MPNPPGTVAIDSQIFGQPGFFVPIVLKKNNIINDKVLVFSGHNHIDVPVRVLYWFAVFESDVDPKRAILLGLHAFDMKTARRGSFVST